MSIFINRAAVVAVFMSIVQNIAAGAVCFDELRVDFGKNSPGTQTFSKARVCRGQILRRFLTFARIYV